MREQRGNVFKIACVSVNHPHAWLQAFREFLCLHLVESPPPDFHYGIWHITQLKEYVLYSQRSDLRDDPWQIPWQAGEVVRINPLCRQDVGYDGGPYCIRCGRYNSLNDGGNWTEGGIEW